MVVQPGRRGASRAGGFPDPQFDPAGGFGQVLDREECFSGRGEAVSGASGRIAQTAARIAVGGTHDFPGEFFGQLLRADADGDAVPAGGDPAVSGSVREQRSEQRRQRPAFGEDDQHVSIFDPAGDRSEFTVVQR